MNAKQIIQTLVLILLVSSMGSRAWAAGFSVGSINGQDGWTVGDPAWHELIDNVHVAYSGDQSWHFSNGGTAGNPIGNNTSPQSPQPSGAFAGMTAGQPSSGATFDGFAMNFKFRPASEVQGDGTEVRIRLISPTGAFVTDLAMQNIQLGGGLELLSLQNGASNMNDLTSLASGVSNLGPDNGWHDLTIVARYFDGASNDTSEYFLDGTSLGGQTTTYFEQLRALAADPYEKTNHVLFDGDRTGNSFNFVYTNSPGGFYFDDFSMSFFDQTSTLGPTFYSTDFEPAPAIPLPAAAWMGFVLLSGMGGAGAIRRRRHNDAFNA